MVMAGKGVTMSQLPMVSVCVANYNGIEIIDACLQSILRQDCDFAVEILVHDDASTDASVSHIRNQHAGITLIESTENVGFCVANNRMAAAARGSYLLLLNNDAVLLPDALRTLYADARHDMQPTLRGLPQYDAHSGDLVDRGTVFDLFLNPIPNLDPRRQDVGMVIGACLWIPKTVWNEIGGFPEWFGSIAEDMYLCCRARLTGYPVRVANASGYRHWQGKSFGGNRIVDNTLSTTFRRRRLSERNKTFVIAMTYPAPAVLALLPLHLILLLAEGLALTVLKRNVRFLDEIYLPCVGDLWRHRAQVLVTRRTIQEARRIKVSDFFSVFSWVPHKLRMLARHGVPEVR